VIGILLALACGSNPAREAIEAQRAPAPAAGWTCPMHPEVHAAGPGMCPVCAMPLVEGGR
jgi:membrane fusion protein, copper/silver efflux system